MKKWITSCIKNKIIIGRILFASLFLIFLGYKGYRKYVVYKEEKLIQHQIENFKELEKAFDKVREVLDNDIKFMENFCFSFWKGNNVSSDIAVKLCSCETENYSKKLPQKDIWFLEDNLMKMDFLIYKKDPEALTLNEKIKNIRLDCIKDFEEKEKTK